jgi:release factor glutamine methyltransferase
MHIAQALAHAHTLGVGRLDAQRLLAHGLRQSRAWLIAHDDLLLNGAQQQDYLAALAHRLAGVPVAYLVGEKEFFGLALNVTPDVLVPRPETEGLVDWALELLRKAPEPTMVDLGTGSGAIALALARHAPQTAVVATDASVAALGVARRNAIRHGLAVEFVHGDWWAPLAGRCFGLAVSNPPYVAGNDPHLHALAHEPRGALTPEGDGLAALRQIVGGAPDHLNPGAWLLLEHGHDQAAAVRGMLQTRGFDSISTRADLAGIARCSGGAWTPQA